MPDVSPPLLLAVSTLWAGLLGSFVAALGTGIGALPVFLKRNWSDANQALMLSIAGGIMLAATVFSLILPALGVLEDRGLSPLPSAAIVAAGTLLGALSIAGLNARVPHEHFVKGREGRLRTALGRHWLLILAITIHNFPEGLSVGVSYGLADTATSHALTAAIFLQNLPEGLAVAAALVGEGSSASRAFVVALLTGLVEVLGGFVDWGHTGHGVALAAIGHLLAPAFERLYVPSSVYWADLFNWGSHPLLDPLWSSAL